MKISKGVLLLAAGLVLLAGFYLRNFFLLAPLRVWGWSYRIKISASPWSRIGLHTMDLRNVVVRNRIGEIILSSPSIAVSYLPSYFLKGKVSASFSRIRLLKPTIFLHRYPNAEWSFSSIRFPLDIPRTLRPEVRIEDGDLELADEQWLDKEKPFQISMSHFQGTLDFRNPVFSPVTMEGTLGRGTLRLDGTLVFPPFRGSFLLTAARLPLSILGNYLMHASKFIRFSEGSGTGKIRFLLSTDKFPEMAGSMAIENASFVFLSLRNLEVNHLSSDVFFNRAFLEFPRITGRVGEAGMIGKGILWNPFSDQSSFYYSVQSAGFSLETLNGLAPILRRIHLSGSGHLSLKLWGRNGETFLEGGISAQHPSLHAYPIDSLTAGFAMGKDAFFLEQASFRKGGGSASLEGIAGLPGSSGYIFRGKNLPFDTLPLFSEIYGKNWILPRKATGKSVSFSTVIMENQGEPIVAGTGNLHDFSLKPLHLSRLTSTFLSTPAMGWIEKAEGIGSSGKLSGNGGWMGNVGNSNPLLFGKIQGSLFGLPLHTSLFGSRQAGLAADRYGAFSWQSSRKASGFLTLPPVPLSSFLFPSQSAIRGKFSGSLFLSTDFKSPLIAGAGKIDSLQVGKVEFPESRWSFLFHHFQRKKLFSNTAPEAVYNLISPALLSFGQINEKQEANLFLFAHPASKALSMVALGTLQGRFLDSNLSVSVIGNGEWLRNPVSFQGEFQSPRKNPLTISSLEGFFGKSLVRVSAKIPKTFHGLVQVKSLLRDVKISDLARFSGFLSFPNHGIGISGFPGQRVRRSLQILGESFRYLSGNLSGNFRVEGPLENPQGFFHFYVREGSFLGEPFSMAYADARLAGGKISFAPLIARFRENYLMARGTLGKNGMASLAFQIPQLYLPDLEFLRKQLGLVSGKARLAGEIRGFFWDPEISGNLEAFNLHGSYLTLDTVFSRWVYHHRLLEVRKAEISRTGGSIVGTARLQLNHPKEISAEADFSNMNLSSLFSSPLLAPVGLAGGHLSLAGSFPGAHGNFHVNFSRTGKIWGEASGEIQQFSPILSSLVLHVGESEITGKSQETSQTVPQFSVQGKNLDLGWMGRAFHLPAELSGNGNFHGTIAGPLFHPVLKMEVAVRNPSYKNWSASGFHGMLVYQKGALHLQRGVLENDSGSLQISGTFPASFSSGEKAASAPVDMHFQLSNQSFQFLSRFFPHVQGTGTVNASVSVHGNPGNFAWEGNGNIQNGTLHLPGIGNPIEKADSDFWIVKNLLQFRLTGLLKNPVTAEGIFHLQESDLMHPLGDGALRVKGNELLVELPETAQLITTTDLVLEKQLERWKLQGTSTIENGTVELIPLLRNPFQTAYAGLENVFLNTTIRVRNNITLKHPNFQFQGEGTLLFTGTLRYPRISGELIANQGFLYAAKDRYRIESARAYFSEDRVYPLIRLNALSEKIYQGSRLKLSLYGDPRNLSFQLSAARPLSSDILSMNYTQQQFLERIFRVSPAQGPAPGEVSVATRGGSPSSFIPLQGALGLHYVALDILPSGQPALKVGKEIAPRLSLSYARPVPGTLWRTTLIPEVVWGIEYEVNPHLSLQISQDNLTGYGGQLVTRFPF